VAVQLPELRRGRIVWASLRDHNGKAKERPAIVLTATPDIRLDGPVEVVAVTTAFPEPPPPEYVELPWDPQGRAKTRLRKRSAAVLTWIAELHHDDVLEYYGEVPSKVMKEILERLLR
jgi:mRNA-degrading endonuclease toxin of MazEF toxin-antitoxin module